MSIRLKNPENSHDPKLLNLSRYYCEYHYIPPLPPLHAQGLLAQNLGFSAPCLLWESPASWSASAGNPAQPCREGLESTPSAYLTEKREQETKPWGGTKKVLLCIAMNHINPDEKEDRTTLICKEKCHSFKKATHLMEVHERKQFQISKWRNPSRSAYDNSL